MAQSIVDVATYILERTGTVTTMKLQKLAFYSQAQHLAQYLIRPGELSSGDSSALTGAERDLIDGVCSALGGMTGAELSERTHLEDPWLHAREGLAPSAPSDAVITLEAMRRYYQEHPVFA